MTNRMKRLIDERESQEALESRYSGTINRHRWNNFENMTLPLYELIGRYIDECDEEDAGIYRNHKYRMTSYQKQWYKDLMKEKYKYMITIKLPYRMIDGFKRTKNQDEAVKQIRKLIREIERAYTGHYHFEKDGFDFNCAIEHGESGFWHGHLVVIADTMNYETYYNKLQKAIDSVLQQHRLFKNCIKLTYVYDQEGLCMYLVKELEEQDNNHLQKWYSHISSLYGLFHIKVNAKQHKLNTKLYELLKSVIVAVKSKQERALIRPNPIHKLNTDKITYSKSQSRRARTKPKRKR